MSIYLCDKPFGENGFRIAQHDPDAKIVLIKDGVYLDTSTISDKPIYAMRDDVKMRGLLNRMGDKITLIDYPELVDLIVENKVMNFI
jgi:sulfur relay protein TusB/DsrH